LSFPEGCGVTAGPINRAPALAGVLPAGAGAPIIVTAHKHFLRGAPVFSMRRLEPTGPAAVLIR
jgi:hypothetical protein